MNQPTPPPTWIVIPTYWGHPQGHPSRPGDAIFDHPTPLNGESTLPRLLESLSQLENARFGVLVLTAATHPALDEDAAIQVERLIAPFRSSYPIVHATEAEAALIRQRYPGLADHVQMRGYAGVRNLQLLFSHVLGAEVVVALDDDEVVKPNYLRIATEYIGHTTQVATGKSQPILGLAGFYENAEGDTFLSEGNPTGNIFLDKARVMNAGTSSLLNTPGRLASSLIAFGGNMVFHRDLFTRVGFDPDITRGEDLDYVLNARLAGFTFWLDKEVRITHLPPHEYDTHPYVKMAEDVRRFIYQREKSKLAKERGLPVPTMDEMRPYPGRFLSDDLPQQARVALTSLATPDMIARYGEPNHIVEQAITRVRDLAPRYFDFATTWSRLMDKLACDPELHERLSLHLCWDTQQ